MLSHPLFSHAVLHVDHGRKLFHAWGTPSSPEIKDHHLADKLTQRNLMVGVLYRKIWSQLSNARWARTARAAGQKKKAEQERESDTV